MQSFIVLGIIPGLNIQTNFTFWVSLTLGVASIPLVLRILRLRYMLRAYLAARKINHFIAEYQFQVPA